MMLPHAPEAIPVAVERVLDSMIGGLALAGVTWMWLRVARRQNSASRFIILFILLIGIAVLPMLGFSWIGRGTNAVSTHSLFTLPQNAAEYLFLAWAAMAVAGLLRIAVGFLQLRKLQRSCAVVESAVLDARVADALRNSPREAILCTSERVNVPTALGFSRPARIAIPAWLLDQLSPEELHHLVLHELAHLRRWDDWSNLAQKVLGALLFFHPAVWWLQRRLALEREMACDECVLAQTGNPRAYAKSLAAMAERSFVRRTVALAQAAVSRLHDTTLRVAKILSPASSRTSAAPLLVSVAAVSGLTIAFAVYSPDLVSFSSPSAPAPLAMAQVHAPSLVSPASLKTDRVQAKPMLASVRFTEPASRSFRREQNKTQDSERTALPVAAQGHAVPTLSAGEKVIPAKAAVRSSKKAARPAVFIFWQETYRDGDGNVFQRSYWRVVVLNNSPKEQPKTI